MVILSVSCSFSRKTSFFHTGVKLSCKFLPLPKIKQTFFLFQTLTIATQLNWERACSTVSEFVFFSREVMTELKVQEKN